MIVDKILAVMEDYKKKYRQSSFVFVTGWITSDNEVIQCDMYDHFRELRKFEQYKELFEEFDNAVEQDAEAEHLFLMGYEDDDHIPWHCFDTNAEQTTVRDKIMKQIYSDGWIRFGIQFYPKNMKNRPSDHVSFEGHVDRLKYVQKDGKILAELFDAKLNFAETK